jgi:hypothetical protein
MAVDPGRQWKGPWRWFSEELLDCCEPLESIAVHGITIDRFACLAACNGATAVVHRALESGERTRSSSAVGAADGEAGEPAELHAFRETVRAICAGEAPPATSSDGCCAGAGSGSGSGRDACDSLGGRDGSAAGTVTHGAGCCDTACQGAAEAADHEDGQPRAFLAVSYSRKTFQQTGDGHFSPVGAYHADSDQVLILDTARFKYPPHWVPLPLLWQSMLQQDPSTGLTRGYVTLTRAKRRTGSGWESQQLRLKLLPLTKGGRCASKSLATRALLLVTSINQVYETLQDALAATLQALSSQAFRVEFRDAPVCRAGVTACEDAHAFDRSRRETRDELDRFVRASCSKALLTALEGSVAAGHHESAGMALAHLLAVPRSFFLEAGSSGWRDTLVAELPDTSTMSNRLQDEVEGLQRQFTEACCACADLPKRAAPVTSAPVTSAPGTSAPVTSRTLGT